jgi:inosine-uridine nucleoside N-ribohydrolase
VADVETTGELTRGTLVLDRRRFQHRQPNVEIVATVERDAAVDYFCRGLRRAATRRG